MGAGQAVWVGVLFLVTLLISGIALRHHKRKTLRARKARQRRRLADRSATPAAEATPRPAATGTPVGLSLVGTDDLAETLAEQAKARRQTKDRFMKFDQGRGLQRAKNPAPWVAGGSLGGTMGGIPGEGAAGGDGSACGGGGGCGGGGN